MSVGSGDLYRRDANVSKLVQKMNNIRGMLKEQPNYPAAGIKVEHSDTSNISTSSSP